MKHCTTCKHEKPLDEFPSRKTAADGLAAMCRTCTAKSRKYHHDNYQKKKRAAEKRALNPTDGVYWPATTTL